MIDAHWHTALNHKENNRVAKKYTTSTKSDFANMTKAKQSERSVLETR